MAFIVVGCLPVIAQTTEKMNRIDACKRNYRQLFGAEALTGQGTDPEMMDILQKFIFGEVFQTGSLTMKQREMITCITLAVQQAIPQLEAHAGAALNVGVSPEELREVVYLTAPFIGFPKMLNATVAVNAVFEEHGIELRVHPALVPMRRLLANVEGVMNAVVVKGDAVGSTLFYGRGAGAEPTASAVVADLVDIVRMTAAGDAQALKPAEHNQETTQLGWLPMSQTVSSYYLRIPVADEPGVLAQVARIFAEQSISIESLFQPEAVIGEKDTEIVVMTHSAVEGAVTAAIEAIEALAGTRGKVVMIRKEELN